MKVDGHGGSRPGSGRPKAEDIPDDKRCVFIRRNGERCGNAASQLDDDDRQRCRWHGGKPHSVAEKEAARERLRQLAADLRLSTPKTDHDYLAVCAEYIARLNRHFALLEVALDEKRLDLDDEIELTRDLSDILAEQRATAREVRDTMKTAAAIGLMARAGDLLDAVAAQSWIQTRSIILSVLEDHPEARAALSDRLAAEGALLLALPVLDAVVE